MIHSLILGTDGDAHARTIYVVEGAPTDCGESES
jgi:hypothetical protein